MKNFHPDPAFTVMRLLWLVKHFKFTFVTYWNVSVPCTVIQNLRQYLYLHQNVIMQMRIRLSNFTMICILESGGGKHRYVIGSLLCDEY